MEFDRPFGESSGAGVIFGATGGVMEAALRSAYFMVTGENPPADAYPGDSRYVLEPFCIDNGQAEFFDLGTEPIYRACFSLTEDAVQQKGFEISDACIGCGRCSRQCPQQCIAQGAPYRIRQANCLHCGLCAEVCPVRAVVKRGE